MSIQVSSATSSCQPLRLRNDTGDNEVTPGAVHKYLGIYLTVDENPGKHLLGDHLKDVRQGMTQIECMSPNKLEKIAQYVTEKNRMEQGKKRFIVCISINSATIPSDYYYRSQVKFMA